MGGVAFRARRASQRTPRPQWSQSILGEAVHAIAKEDAEESSSEQEHGEEIAAESNVLQSGLEYFYGLDHNLCFAVRTPHECRP